MPCRPVLSIAISSAVIDARQCAGCVAVAIALVLFSPWLPEVLGQIRWEPVPGPYGGALSTLVRDSVGILYTAHSGPIYRSTDDGVSWHSTGSRAGSEQLTLLLGTPDGALLAACLPDSIFRSTDHGATWSFVHDWSTWRRGRRPLAVDAAGNIYLTNDTAVLRSTDDGLTWRLFVSNWSSTIHVAGSDLYLLHGTYMSRYSTLDSLEYRSLQPPVLLDVLATAPDGALWGMSVWNGVYRSNDRGETWVPVEGAPAAGLNAQFLWLDERTLLLAGGLSVFRTTDDGTTWDTLARDTVLFPLGGMTGTRSGALVAISNDGIARSVDNGRNWVPSNEAIRARSVSGIAGDATGRTVYAYMPGIDGNAWCTLWLTTDGGASWHGLRLPPELEIITTWTVTSSGVIYAATWGSIVTSRDMGETWIELPEIGAGLAPLWIAARGDTVFFVSNRISAHTLIGGGEWHQANIGPRYEPVTVAIDSAGGLLLSTRDELLRSSDGGVMFKRIGSIDTVDSYYPQPMAVAPDGAIYIARDRALLRVEPATGSTERIDFAAHPDIVTALAFPSRSSILVGTDSSGVHYLDDSGWLRVNDAIESNRTSALFAHRGRAWAGTAHAGLFVAELTSGTSPALPATDGIEMSVDVHGDIVTITVVTTTPTPISVAFFDVRGREVIAPPNGTAHTGGYRAEIDASGLSSGAYLVRLQAGDRVVVRRVFVGG